MHWTIVETRIDNHKTCRRHNSIFVGAEFSCPVTSSSSAVFCIVTLQEKPLQEPCTTANDYSKHRPAFC